MFLGRRAAQGAAFLRRAVRGRQTGAGRGTEKSRTAYRPALPAAARVGARRAGALGGVRARRDAEERRGAPRACALSLRAPGGERRERVRLTAARERRRQS